MERGPFRDATRSSDGHEIPRVLWNSKVHCRVLNSPPFVPTLNQINPSQLLLSYSRKILINITFPFMLGLEAVSLRQIFQPNPHLIITANHKCLLVFSFTIKQLSLSPHFMYSIRTLDDSKQPRVV